MPVRGLIIEIATILGNVDLLIHAPINEHSWFPPCSHGLSKADQYYQWSYRKPCGQHFDNVVATIRERPISDITTDHLDH